MNRRDVLKNSASVGMLALGATSAATAMPEDDPQVAVVQNGERVAMPLSEADVSPEDCCFEPDGCSACTCRCCYC